MLALCLFAMLCMLIKEASWNRQKPELILPYYSFVVSAS